MNKPGIASFVAPGQLHRPAANGSRWPASPSRYSGPRRSTKRSRHPCGPTQRTRARSLTTCAPGSPPSTPTPATSSRSSTSTLRSAASTARFGMKDDERRKANGRLGLRPNGRTAAVGRHACAPLHRPRLGHRSHGAGTIGIASFAAPGQLRRPGPASPPRGCRIRSDADDNASGSPSRRRSRSPGSLVRISDGTDSSASAATIQASVAVDGVGEHPHPRSPVTRRQSDAGSTSGG
jgi:hypothetical protein